MSMLASIPVRRRCEVVGARLVRPGVRLNPELGQLYSLSEASVSSGYINMVIPLHSHSSWAGTTTTTSPSIKVQSRCNQGVIPRKQNRTSIPLFFSCRINASQGIGLTDKLQRKRDKPLHELDEGRADYKALEALKKKRRVCVEVSQE